MVYLIINFCIISYISLITSAFPVNWIRQVAENSNQNDFENYLSKFGDTPDFGYTLDNHLKIDEEIDFKSLENQLESKEIQSKDISESTNKMNATKLKDDVENIINLLGTIVDKKNDTESTVDNDNHIISTVTTMSPRMKELLTNVTNFIASHNLTNANLNPLLDGNWTFINDTFRLPRQKDVENDTDVDPEFQKASQEEDDSEEGNMVTGLIGSFLSSLSRPDGSIDLEAITTLLGGLSAQNPDGSYNFNGLTELLMNFFGADEEGGGGSDLGAFVGGLLGAILKGVANPPGAKGAGNFLGKVAAGVVPALSGPAPASENKPPEQPLDSGGFLSGLLSTLIGALGSMSSSSSGSGANEGGGGGSKFSLFKMVFSLITSVFTASSSSKGDH